MQATTAVRRSRSRFTQRWPCNANSVCLDPCHLPRPEARSTDFGLSAGILAAGPAEAAYSLEASRVTDVGALPGPLCWLRGSKPTYRTALARLAEISSIAARSASLTISPPSRWAFAPLCASVRMTPAEKLRQQTLSSANGDQDKQE